VLLDEPLPPAVSAPTIHWDFVAPISIGDEPHLWTIGCPRSLEQYPNEVQTAITRGLKVTISLSNTFVYDAKWISGGQSGSPLYDRDPFNWSADPPQIAGLHSGTIPCLGCPTGFEQSGLGPRFRTAIKAEVDSWILPPGGARSVTITSPASGGQFIIGSSIQFSGSSSAGAGSGTRGAGQITWISDRQGEFASGESAQFRGLVGGLHVIEARVWAAIAAPSSGSAACPGG
jgi:hypothetical protein